jgi:hypothetical protein
LPWLALFGLVKWLCLDWYDLMDLIKFDFWFDLCGDVGSVSYAPLG